MLSNISETQPLKGRERKSLARMIYVLCLPCSLAGISFSVNQPDMHLLGWFCLTGALLCLALLLRKISRLNRQPQPRTYLYLLGTMLLFDGGSIYPHWLEVRTSYQVAFSFVWICANYAAYHVALRWVRMIERLPPRPLTPHEQEARGAISLATWRRSRRSHKQNDGSGTMH